MGYPGASRPGFLKSKINSFYMSIKAKSLETVTTYEVDDVSFFDLHGSIVAIAKDAIVKAGIKGDFFVVFPKTNESRYNETIAECMKWGTEVAFDQFEKAAGVVNDCIQSKVAFIKESLALEGMGPLAD